MFHQWIRYVYWKTANHEQQRYASWTSVVIKHYDTFTIASWVCQMPNIPRFSRFAIPTQLAVSLNYSPANSTLAAYFAKCELLPGFWQSFVQRRVKFRDKCRPARSLPPTPSAMAALSACPVFIATLLTAPVSRKDSCRQITRIPRHDAIL